LSESTISDYALLSDCHSSALVRNDGSIDWYCTPRFDSPSIFARLLDPDGGHWSIRPVANGAESERHYLDDSLVLRTVFHTDAGSVALTDALAFEKGARGHEVGIRVPHILLRHVEGLKGTVDLMLEFVPRLEYGLTTPLLTETEGGLVVHGGPVELHLITNCPLEISDNRATARFQVQAGEMVDFVLTYHRFVRTGDGIPPVVNVQEELKNATRGWRSWAEMHHTYQGLYTPLVRRSALVLKALTYEPSGGIIAAPTTSLPETPGGSDNWDYRFVWLRDLSLTLRALWVAACPTEAERFFHWISRAMGAHEGHEVVQIMYGVEGERDLTEHTLEHLSGFAGSSPVRVGNDAWKQVQLDVMGEIVDAVHLLQDQLGEEFDVTVTRLVTDLADRAAEMWREPGAGMWEARDKRRHYLTSKVMCWVALDRAIDLAPRIGMPDRVDAWETARDAVRSEILERGWCEKVGAYTGAFGSDHLDASVLLMPLVDFLPADDPRMRSTIDAIERELVTDRLVHRWAGDENGFLICTYWLVECLAMAGDVERATELFERATALANDVGLLAEEADPHTGVMWGNFPQAFSHIGLINAAWRLDEIREKTRD
jgi:GH15 family glucan-1,4-alpha-glucosidase